MARAQAVGSPVLVLTVDLAVVGARHRDTRNAMVGETLPVGEVASRRRHRPRTRAGSVTSPLGGKPLTFGNLEKAVPERAHPGRVSPVGRRPVRPERDLGRHRLGARALERAAGGQGSARSRGRPPRASTSASTAVVVSNHGGRQLDSVPSTVRALPDVVDAVGDQVEVLADGGVRTGLDVVKMVALGARAVLIGRAWAWSVAAARRGRRPSHARRPEGRHRRRARAHRTQLDRRRRPLGALPDGRCGGRLTREPRRGLEDRGARVWVRS